MVFLTKVPVNVAQTLWLSHADGSTALRTHRLILGDRGGNVSAAASDSQEQHASQAARWQVDLADNQRMSEEIRILFASLTLRSLWRELRGSVPEAVPVRHECWFRDGRGWLTHY